MESLPETLNWLYSLEARGEIYKLERMEQALALIGNPHSSTSRGCAIYMSAPGSR